MCVCVCVCEVGLVWPAGPGPLGTVEWRWEGGGGHWCLHVKKIIRPAINAPALPSSLPSSLASSPLPPPVFLPEGGMWSPVTGSERNSAESRFDSVSGGQSVVVVMAKWGGGEKQSHLLLSSRIFLVDFVSIRVVGNLKPKVAASGIV